MSSTETGAGAPVVPGPRAAGGEALAPWSPSIPTQRGTPRGIRWVDAPEDPPPADVPPRRSRRGPVALVVAAVLLVVVGVGVAGVLHPGRPTMTVPGSLVVAGRGALPTGSSCSVSTMPGHTLTIFGPGGRVLGSAALASEGTAVDQWHTTSPFADACRFGFTVTGVAADEDSYRVGLDGDPADAVPFGHDELTTTGAQLTYGH